MKYFSSLVICLFAFTSIAAQNVPEQDARLIATKFLESKQKTLTAKHPKYSLQKKEHQKASALYYVFNADDEGFVIVSGDKRTMPILGYAPKGIFEEESIPENLKVWLEGYAEQLRQLDGNSYVTDEEGPNDWDIVNPMIITRWNQDYPYNNNCPTLGGYGRTVTGCVATSMAQIMYFHKHPTATTTTIPGYTCSTNWAGIGRLELSELEPITFQWDNMMTAYFGGETTEQQAAVAQLIQYCGTAVNMEYRLASSGGSSASSLNMVTALKTYFNYDEGIRYLSRNNYSTSDWEQLIYNELKERRPVVYDGQSTGGGHAFICDGYSGNHYFHINWGWCGNYDGDFLLSILRPESEGIGGSTTSDGYSMNQGAIVGIQPQTSSTVEQTPVLYASNIYQQNGSQLLYNKSNQTLQITQLALGFGSELPKDHKFYIGWGIYDNNEKLLAQPRDYYGQAFSVQGSYTGTFTLTAVASGAIENGKTYTLRPMCKEESASEWLPFKNSEIYHIVITADSKGQLSISTPKTDIRIDSYNMTTEGYVNEEQILTVNISNTGDTPFRNNLYLFQNNLYLCGQGISIEQGEKSTVSFVFTPTTLGEQSFQIYADQQRQNLVGTLTLNITEKPAYSTTLSYENVSFKNATSTAVYGSILNGTVTVVNTDETLGYVGYLQTQLYQNDSPFGSYSFVSRQDTKISIEPGGSTEVPVKFDGLNIGKYYIIVFSAQNVSNTRQLSAMQVNPTITVYSSDGTNTDWDVSTPIPSGTTAIDLRGIQTVPTIDYHNPNCLYLFDIMTEIPYELADHNIVIDGNAERITLTDYAPFFSPIAFKANEISYTTQFAARNESNGGWNTLYLPFMPTECTISNGETSIDWFRSDTDKNKQFWVMQFDGIEGDVAQFVNASMIKPYKPYLVTVPGTSYGNLSLEAEPITFMAKDVELTGTIPPTPDTNQSMHFLGTTVGLSDPNIYVLDDNRLHFVRSETQEAFPFRAYFTLSNDYSGEPIERISIQAQLNPITGILQTQMAKEAGAKGIYTADGKKLNLKSAGTAADLLKQLPKGIYIIDGKKYAK